MQNPPVFQTGIPSAAQGSAGRGMGRRPDRESFKALLPPLREGGREGRLSPDKAGDRHIQELNGKP